MLIFYTVYGLWISSEVLLNRLMRSGSADKKKTDNHTEIYLWLTIVGSTMACVFLSKQFPMPIISSIYFNYFGLAVIVIGMLIRLMAIKQLGRFFTVDVTIRKDHQLMQSGFYKYLRHPSYTGSILSFIGFGLSWNNWLGLVVVFVPIVLVFIYRINIEEKVLTQQFGPLYSDYMSRSKRLLPFVY
jgi:protein-S-isoprenylcysteine O-methyltransferase Ste14